MIASNSEKTGTSVQIRKSRARRKFIKILTHKVSGNLMTFNFALELRDGNEKNNMML